MNKSKTLRLIIKLAVVTAIYVALTIALYPLSYGSIQFRLSEFLMLLVCYNPLYSISLTLGCLLANIASPMGAVDVIFGTLATFLSCIPMIFIKRNKYVASIIPSLVNAVIIGLELQFAYAVPLYLGAIQVFIGEFVVVTIIGVPVFKALEKNERIVETLEMKVYNEELFIDKFLTSRICLSLALFAISLVMYFRLGLYYDDLGDGNYLTYSLSYFTFDDNGHNNYPFIFAIVLLPFLSLLSSILLKPLASFVVNLVTNTLSLVILILAFLQTIHLIPNGIDARFYFYFVFFIICILIEITMYIKNTKDNTAIKEKKESEVYSL